MDALPLVPYLVSGLLISCRSEEAKSAGAGVTVALSLCLLPFSIFVSVIWFPGPNSYAPPRMISSSMFAACSVWVMVSGFMIARKAGLGLILPRAICDLGGNDLRFPHAKRSLASSVGIYSQ